MILQVPGLLELLLALTLVLNVGLTQSLRASNRSVLVGEGLESSGDIYNVGPGGWVLYAAALKRGVICQGCAAVLIEKLIYIRSLAYAAPLFSEVTIVQRF